MSRRPVSNFLELFAGRFQPPTAENFWLAVCLAPACVETLLCNIWDHIIGRNEHEWTLVLRKEWTWMNIISLVISYFTVFSHFFISSCIYSDRVQLFLNWFRCLLVPLKRPPPPTSDRSEVEGCRIGTAVAWSTWTTFGKATVFEWWSDGFFGGLELTYYIYIYTLLGTNISPDIRPFWVDDFPNFPRWDMLIFPGG